MLHPIGRQPSAVYWRRRVLIVGILGLTLLTIYVAFLRGGKHDPTAAGSSTGRPASTAVAVSTPATSEAASSPAAPAACAAGQLALTATTDAKSYPLGGTPTLSLVVLNKGPAACLADLSERQTQLLVSSGGARVWGSQDCLVNPQASQQTLPVGSAVTRAVQWSGLTSQPGCTTQRQRVPAGTYTLTASLAGQLAAPAEFSFVAP